MKFPENIVPTAQTQVALQNPAGRFFVYLLHFENPLQKSNGRCAGHYIGLTGNVAKRLNTHAKGNGNGLVKAALMRGKIVVVKLWQQDGHFEQKLKAAKNASLLCPICRQKKGLSVNKKSIKK